LRIADWFGIYQVIASGDTADVYNPKTVQATMGSIARVGLWYKKLGEWLANATVPVYGALLNGADVYKTGKIKEGLLVIGNEGGGIRGDVLPFIQMPLTIPCRGKAESLNAAVATGIILSHILGE
jgi:TrmH family RNA methyltransferase